MPAKFAYRKLEVGRTADMLDPWMEMFVNAYMPKDFSSKGSLHLLKGRLESEVLIELR